MNPFATWADVLLKSGKAMMESLQESARKTRAERVAVIPTPDAPQPAVRREPAKPPAKKARPKLKKKAQANAPAKPKAKRRAKR